MTVHSSNIKEFFKGEMSSQDNLLEEYSYDSSIFELTPELILHPRDSSDICQLVKYVAANKALYPTLSITPRGAGTCMSGGPINTSLILDMKTHFTHISTTNDYEIRVQPGAYMRDIDVILDKSQLLLGCVPASRALCTIGGMVGNNSGGEQSLRYGNTENSVSELKAVLADGKEYVFSPLNRHQLELKLSQTDFEGEVYRNIYKLIEDNYALIHNARPSVNKNSMGYNLWSVWNRETGIFDMSRLLTGSQGTLGVITDVKLRLHPKPHHTGLLVMYLKDQQHLGEIIAKTTEHNPITFEGFDDITFELGLKNFGLFKKQLGFATWAKEQAALLGTVAKFKGHLPNMVLMAEFDGDNATEVHDKITALRRDLYKYKLNTTVTGEDETASGFWRLRRSSLALLRAKVHDKYAAPFIDDLTIQPDKLPEFLPKLRKVIRKYQLPATIAGHFGDGNFHIIPLLDISDNKELHKLEPAMREIIPLVLEYGGTLAGEHNDGMIRGPWLPAVFGEEMNHIFKQTKDIFDPSNIFNPHKKTDADWDFSMDNIRRSKTNELITIKNS